MVNNFSNEINEICSYLKRKYGEKFVVVSLVSDDGVLDVPNKAYVHPEGREAEWFAVRFDKDENTEAQVFRDGYGFIFAEQTILPAFQALFINTSSTVKLTVEIENELEVTRAEHEKGVSFEAFAEKEYPFGININVFVSDEVLIEKEIFYENLSRILNDMPGRSFFYKFYFVFVKSDEFDTFGIDEYRGTDSFIFKSSADEITAFTKVVITEEMYQAVIIDELKAASTDDMKLNLSGIEDDEDGEENE
jgi:hypothetical protein